MARTYWTVQPALTRQANTNNSDGEPYCIHRDPLYGISNTIISRCQAAKSWPLIPSMEELNKGMSPCRVTVEWASQEITSKRRSYACLSRRVYIAPWESSACLLPCLPICARR